MSNPFNEDKSFLVLVRQTLAAVARDTAPTAGHPHLLKDSTIQLMRECFAAVSQREHDYRRRHNSPKQTPYYPSDQPRAQVVRFASKDKK